MCDRSIILIVLARSRVACGGPDNTCRGGKSYVENGSRHIDFLSHLLRITSQSLPYIDPSDNLKEEMQPLDEDSELVSSLYLILFACLGPSHSQSLSLSLTSPTPPPPPQTESPIKSVDHGNRASVTAATTNFSDLHGYLKKKSRHDRWQKRWFEANDHYLTYYKSPQSEKLLACIDLYQTGAIKLATERDDDTGDDARSEFSLELGDRFYIIKAETPGDAKRWVEGLNERKKPKEAKKTPSGSSPAKKTPQGEGR